MSKEKGCKCCKQIWYEDMLDKKWKLCPNCYEYCKPLIDDLKIKDKKIAYLQHLLEVAEKALELACIECAFFDYSKTENGKAKQKRFIKQAEKEVKGEK